MYYLSSEATLTLAVFSACTAVVIVAGAYLRQQHRKRTKAREDQQNVIELLQIAMTTNSFFDMTIADQDVRVKDCRCQCVAVDPENITMQFGEENPVTLWTGKQASFFFRLVTHNTVRFFDFVSTLQHVKKNGMFFQVTLPLPIVLNNQQRRVFVRFEPAEFTLPKLGVWFGKPVTSPPVADSQTALEHVEADKHATRTLHWHSLPDNQVRVKDVSAGGIQLLLASSNPLWDNLEKGHMFLVETTLTESAYKSPITIVMAGSVTRILPTSRVGICGAGIKFQRWAQVIGNKKTEWIPLRNLEGIPPLTAWIMLRQREQMRNIAP